MESSETLRQSTRLQQGGAWLRRSAGRPPLIVAHRGASGLAPENTLASFRLAIELGSPAVECDVHLSSDGVPVVIHDGTVDRTTSGSGSVASLNFEQLCALDAGSWFGSTFADERIPSLEEVLALCTGQTRLVIELKPGGGAALVEGAMAVVDRHPQCEVAIISFGSAEVQLVAQRRPDLPLGFLITQRHLGQFGLEEALQGTRDFGADFIAPQADAVDDHFMRRAGKAELPVSVWTVDDPERMRAVSALGVDGITTNRPDVALKALR